MKIKFEYDEEELKKLIIRDIEERLGTIPINEKKITIEVKTKMNFRSEWESGQFKLVYEDSV